MNLFGENMLVISDPSDETPGGVYAFDGQNVQVIDRISTTGLATDASGCLIRLPRSFDEPGSAGELFVYDSSGVRRYLRLDRVADGHGVACADGGFVVASTATNDLVWIDAAGCESARWHADGTGDAWHINDLVVHDGEVCVCAFGRFPDHRGWAGSLEGRGIVFRARDGEPVLSGLTAPHTPRFLDGRWYVCNSGTRELLVIDAATQAVERRIKLRVWPRGLAIHDGFMFVGESEHRVESRDPKAQATVAVVDLTDSQVVDRIAVPGREIYDLIVVPKELASGLATGFRTNLHRARYLTQLALFEQVGVEPTRLWAIGEPLPVEDRRARITAEVPAELPALSTVELEVELENLGGSIFVSALPNPVLLTYRWYPEGSDEYIVEESVMSPVPHPVPPHTPIRCRVRVRTHDAGRYRLRITLAQEFVGWFDEIDGDSFVDADVLVGGAGATIREPLPPEDRRAHVEAEFPDRLPANTTVDLGVKLENLGSDVLVTASPNPVYLTYRWYRYGEASHIVEDPLMTPLPGAVMPHTPTPCVMRIHTHDPGRYLLRLTLAQQFVGWFDETSSDSLIEAVVNVERAC